MNSVHLIGNLSADPKYITTPSGNALATFTLAVDRYYTKQVQGEEYRRKVKETSWIGIVCWHKNAETARKHLQKGSKISIEGFIKSRSLTLENGSQTTIIEIQANVIGFLHKIKKDDSENQDKIIN